MLKQTNSLMKHIFCEGYGAPTVIRIKESPLPVLKPDELLLRIHATSINRADTLQRQGKYQPPPGSTDIMGLEAAGYVINGDGTEQRVIALLPGGGYAQYAAVNRGHIIPISNNIPWELAGGIAEVYLTAFLQIQLARLQKGDSCLIYAAGSGVGIATIQLCNLHGIVPIATCSKPKIDAVRKYTPNVIDRGLTTAEQLALIKQIDSQGVDAVFDPVGKDSVPLSLDSLKVDGRWILYGLMSGHIAEQFNLAIILRKRLQLIGTTLRSRTDAFKTKLVADFSAAHLADLESGVLRPEVHSTSRVTWDEEGARTFQRLHTDIESNVNTGKLNVVFE